MASQPRSLVCPLRHTIWKKKCQGDDSVSIDHDTGNYLLTRSMTPPFKLQLNRLLTRNLEIYLEKNLDDIYRSSRIYVQKKTKLLTLPDENPYLLTD